MRIDEMSKNQKFILFVVLSGAWIGFLVYWNGQGSSEEAAVAARIRKAKKITVEVKLQNGSSGLLELTGDHDGLAKTFRVLENTASTVGIKTSVPIYDLDDTSDQVIIWLFPPEVANIGGRLHRIDPAFWQALLERAPKAKEFLEKKSPKEIPPARPKPMQKKEADAKA